MASWPVHHMILRINFPPPQQGAVSNTWTLSIEGDKSTFPADVGYSLVDTQPPSAEEINVFDTLDERHAVEVFLGKDLEQAECFFPTISSTTRKTSCSWGRRRSPSTSPPPSDTC